MKNEYKTIPESKVRSIEIETARTVLKAVNKSDGQDPLERFKSLTESFTDTLNQLKTDNWYSEQRLKTELDIKEREIERLESRIESLGDQLANAYK